MCWKDQNTVVWVLNQVLSYSFFDDLPVLYAYANHLSCWNWLLSKRKQSLSLALGLWKYKLPVILIFLFSILRCHNRLLFESWKHLFQFLSWYLSLFLFCKCKFRIWLLIIGLSCTENREIWHKKGVGGVCIVRAWFTFSLFLIAQALRIVGFWQNRK